MRGTVENNPGISTEMPDSSPVDAGSELHASIVRVETLPETLRDEMFALYARYYGGTNSELFHSDLSNKDYAVFLYDRGTLQGFTTVAVAEHQFEGARVREMFSGDTIVDHRYWGHVEFAFAWIRLTGAIKAQAPDTPLYWHFLVMSHRTYRVLKTFYHEFYPAHDRPTPPREQGLMDLMANSRYPDHYDPKTGVVSFPESRGHLKAPWCDIPEKYKNRPDIRFFVERNPNFSRGDELVFLTPLTVENQRPLVRRRFLEGMAKPLR